MKKIVALFLVIGMLLCLFAGCRGEKDPGSSSTPPNAGTQTDSEDDTVDYSKMKVGLLLTNVVVDGGWCQAQAEGLKRAAADLGMTDDQIVMIESLSEGGSEADSTIVQLIDDGCNLIIGGSSGFVTNINGLCAQYPDVYFAQFEGDTSENCCGYSCRDIEAIFMCGYAAALMSDVDQLGYVAPNPQTSVVRGINAFAAGAKAARPNATVQIAWVNSWYDPAIEKECANSLLQSGIKCLGYNGSSTAVCQAAQEAGGYCTGYNIDMHDYAPEAVLTSFCWNWAPQFKEIITQIASDKWDNSPKYAGIEEGAAALSDWNAEIMPADVIEKCNAMYEDILNGKYVVMGGPLSDRDGNELLADGETFTTEELIDCYWLLDNVIGTLP